jgi:basic membrane protein A and related proteins
MSRRLDGARVGSWWWVRGRAQVLLPVLVALLLASCSLILQPTLDDVVECPDDDDVATDDDDSSAVDDDDSGGIQPGPVEFGGFCEGDLDCQSLMCRDHRCTQSCSVTEPCPEDTYSSCEEEICRFSVAPPLQDIPRVGFIYVGPVGDHGWTLTHELSRVYLEETLSDPDAPGDEIVTTYVPSVAPADAPARIDELIDDGYNTIIGTSFDFLSSMQNRAANHTDVNFLACSGFTTSPNLGSYFGRMYQVKWLAGMVAGRMTTTDRIGILGPVVIPETVRHTNAFTQGVRHVNPDAVVHVEWLGAWFDPVNEPILTQALIDGGADVIMTMTDTAIPIQTIEAAWDSENPVYSIGYDNADSCDFGPQSCLTSAYWNWGPTMVEIVEAMRAGTWDPHDIVWDQIKSDEQESIAYLAAMEAAVPVAVQVEVQGYISDLAAPGVEGQQLPFTGPLHDNTGTLRLAAGDLFTDEDLLKMCWLVDGVVSGEFDASEDPVPAVLPPGCVGDQ